MVLLTSVTDSSGSGTPFPEQEWLPATIPPPPPTLPPPQRSDFCYPEANLTAISLDDCGSCHGRCGALNNMDRQEGLCSCDSACMVYDDCCWDFQQECPELHERAAAIRGGFEVLPSAMCFLLSIRTFPAERRFALLINSCGGNSYNYVEITSIPDLYTQVPVLDMDTGIYYINLNCALCNGAQRIQAMGIHLSYEVAFQDDDFFLLGATTVATTAAPTLSTADDVLDAMPDIPFVSYSFPGTPARQCYPDPVNHCPDECDNSELVELCRTAGQSYSATDIRYPTFRNLYCALCNFITIDLLSCSEFEWHEESYEDLSTFSLSFLFDLQELESPSLDSVSLHCFMHDIGLPEGVVCGETVCPNGYTLHEDTCITDQVSPSQLPANETDTVAPCQGFRLPESAFTIENGSLITNDGYVYDEGRFILGNASAVICQANTYTDFSEKSVLGITTIVLCSISPLCLICRLVLQGFWQKYKSFPGRMQFNLVLAMAFAIALLLFSPLATEEDKLCVSLAVLKYYAFLASFVWMTCVAGDTWWALRKSTACQFSHVGSSIVAYLLLGWLLPFIMTITVLSVDLSNVETSFAPRFGGSGCWITQKLPLILFFFLPFFISVVLNIVFFILTIRMLKTAFLASNAIRKSNESQHPWHIYIKLFIIMGLTWLVGFAAVWVDSLFVWFLFVVFNSSQGIFIFLAFVVEFSRIKNIFSCFRCHSDYKESSSVQTGSTQTTRL